MIREFGLILENVDGFDDLENRFVVRGVPHMLAQRTSIASPAGPRTGWSGDGSPGDRSLRSLAIGAVIQHFTQSLNRIAGVDFRSPSDDELDGTEDHHVDQILTGAMVNGTCLDSGIDRSP